jgi:hypothetical protein
MKELPMATKSISKKNSKVSKVKKAGIDAQYPSPKVVCRDKKLKKAKNFAKILKEVTECLNKVWKRLPPSAKFVLRLDSLQVKLVDDIGYFSFAHNYFVKDSCLPGRFTCEIDYNIHGYDYMRYSENMEFVLASSLALVYQYRLVNAAAAGIFGANMVDFLVQDPEDALFKPDEFNKKHSEPGSPWKEPWIISHRMADALAIAWGFGEEWVRAEATNFSEFELLDEDLEENLDDAISTTLTPEIAKIFRGLHKIVEEE